MSRKEGTPGNSARKRREQVGRGCPCRRVSLLAMLFSPSRGLAAGSRTYDQPDLYEKWLGAISGVNQNMAPRTY